MLNSNKQITVLANQLTSGSITNIKPITDKGEVNQVFLLETADQRTVLRVNKATELDRFNKEQWCAKMAHAGGVPVAQVLNIGTSNGYAYMLLEFIMGKNGGEIVSTPELWQTLGKYLRLIHEVPVAGFGEKLDDITSGNVEQWKQYLGYNITSLTEEDVLIKMGVLNISTSQKLSVLFKSLGTKNFTFGLNHGDYSLANIIIDEHAIPHVIDWGCAEAHVVPHHDLGVILDESLKDDSDEFAAFLDGYGTSMADYETMRSDIQALQMLEAIDKLRWAIDKSPESITHCTTQVAKLTHMHFLDQ